MGLHSIGAAVLSIIKGILYFLPISDTSLIGNTLKYGLGRVSPYKALVLSSIDFSKFLGSLGSAYLISIPSLLKVCVNKETVPP